MLILITKEFVTEECSLICQDLDVAKEFSRMNKSLGEFLCVTQEQQLIIATSDSEAELLTHIFENPEKSISSLVKVIIDENNPMVKQKLSSILDLFYAQTPFMLIDDYRKSLNGAMLARQELLRPIVKA